MTQSSQAPAGKVAKLNRAERNAWTKRRIFDAATKIVGKYGYADASVARITEEAGVAQGTFYNHFENRQELLDQLLPKIGLDMLHFIRERTGTADAARQEIERFSAFFEFIEWWAALIMGGDADAYLATQGDVWDTQWDMFLACCGAVTAQLLLARAQDRALARLPQGETDPHAGH